MRSTLQGSRDRCRPVAPRKNGLDGGGTVPVKSLMGIPWRYALRCIDDLGLILRAEVVWSKPNGLPESVTDRVRRSHEQWFHFTLQPRYFSAIDEIREPAIGGQTGLAAMLARPRPSHDLVPGQTATQHRADRDAVPVANPLGRLPSSVWTVPTEPLKVPAELGADHFAAFPTEWPKRLIQGWAPLAGVCTRCEEGRRPVVAIDHEVTRDCNTTGRPKRQDLSGDRNNGWNAAGYPKTTTSATITGYSCACPEPTSDTRPAVVLDPFGGTGTTAMVAKALGATGISIDKSDYCRLAEWRTNDRNQLAKVLGVAKVDAPHPDETPLFDQLEWSGA